MNLIRQELNKLDPSIIIYGEGWSAGPCALPNEQLGMKANIQKMPGIAEADLAVFLHLDAFAVFDGDEALDYFLGIVHGIHRLGLIASGTFVLPVLPLRFFLLNVCAVEEHDRAEIGRGLGRIDIAAEASLVQQRQIARMVHVRVGQKDGFDLGCVHGDILIDKDILALFHAAVHQKLMFAGFQVGDGAGHFMRRTQKNCFHLDTPFTKLCTFIIT